MVRKNRQVTELKIINIGKDNAWKILHGDFNMKQVCAKKVSADNSFDQKQHYYDAGTSSKFSRQLVNFLVFLN